MPDKRSGYFALQGLFMAVLLLIFLYSPSPQSAAWTPRFFSILAALGASLAILRLAPMEVLSHAGFQASLFLGDAVIAALCLYWAGASNELYLLYVFLLFGTALSRSLVQSLFFALVASILYYISAEGQGAVHGTDFWLRLVSIWAAASVLAILSADAERAQAEERGKYEKRIIDAERLAALGQMAAEVAHQIKGPLTSIMVNADVLRAQTRAPTFKKGLGEIRSEASRCGEILRNVLNIGHIEEISLSSLDLRDPLRAALKSVWTRLEKRGVRVETSGLDSPMLVSGDANLLAEALAVLLENALEASREGGRIRVKAGRMVLGPRNSRPRVFWGRLRRRGCAIEVEDEGAGISPENLGSLFKPFFTTKKEGSGLGLARALRILQKHNGTIEASSRGVGLGARFTIVVPAA